MLSSTLKKSELRQIYLDKRKSLTSEELKSYSRSITDNFLAAFNLQQMKTVHCFLPIAKFKEINTFPLIEHFLQLGIEVLVPKIINGEMISVKYDGKNQLIKNSWGILEPESCIDESANKIDIVISPLLYCDDSGNRVGYGKGFYDQFFAKINADALKVGINYFKPSQSISDCFINDIPLDYLVTPVEVLSFLGRMSKFTK